MKVAAIDQPEEVSAAVLLDVSGAGMNIISDRDWLVGSRLVVEMENHLVLARVRNGHARGSKFSLGAEKLHSILKLMLPLDAPRAEWHRILLAEADQTSAPELAPEGTPGAPSDSAVVAQEAEPEAFGNEPEPPLREAPSPEHQATAHSSPDQPNPDHPAIDQPTPPVAQTPDEQTLDAQTVALLTRDLQELDQRELDRKETGAQDALHEKTPEKTLPVPPLATAGPDPSQALEETAQRVAYRAENTGAKDGDPPLASGFPLLPAAAARPSDVEISRRVAPYFGPAYGMAPTGDMLTPVSTIPEIVNLPSAKPRWTISAAVAAGLFAVVALAFYYGPFRPRVSGAPSAAATRPAQIPLTIPPVTGKSAAAPASAQTTVARAPLSTTTPPATTPLAPAASIPTPAGARHATVKASGMNWVSACSDGKAAFAGLLSAGNVRDIDFQRTAVIRIGNAAAAEIYVDGKSIGPLGAPGAVKIVEISGAGLRSLPVNLSPEAECQPKP